MIEKVRNNYFEVFEIHTMPKDVIVYTLKCTENITQRYSVNSIRGIVSIRRSLRKGTYTTVITHKDYGEPKEAMFIPATKSINLIHRYVDKIRKSLEHPNLEIKKI